MPVAYSLAIPTQCFLNRLLTRPGDCVVVGCRPLTVRGLGSPLLPKGAPLASLPSGHGCGRKLATTRVSRLLIRCIGASFTPSSGPLAFYRGLAEVLICNWCPAVYVFLFPFTAGRLQICAV